MGQSSSQPKPDEASPRRNDVVSTMADDTDERPVTANGASQMTNGSQLDLSRQSINLTPTNGGHGSKKKRKAKHSGDHTSPSKRSKLRSIPQSRRGTNIQPDESAQENRNTPGVIASAVPEKDRSKDHNERNETASIPPDSNRNHPQEDNGVDQQTVAQSRKKNKAQEGANPVLEELTPAAVNGAKGWNSPVQPQKKRTDKRQPLQSKKIETPSPYNIPIERHDSSVETMPKSVGNQQSRGYATAVRLPTINKPGTPQQAHTPRPGYGLSASRPKFSSQPRTSSAATSAIDPQLTRSADARPKSAIRKSRERSVRNGFADGGSWSDAEKARADVIFNQTCRDLNISEYELKRQINESWGSMVDFKERVFEAFPRRKRKSIYKFCIRRYHLFDTGPWSAKDDERLREAYAAHPDSWTEIAELVGRSSQACRDRHRNHLKYNGMLELGPWTEVEEDVLLFRVDEALKTIRKAYPRETNEEILEEYINWEQISKGMDGTRSRKRCMEKYRRMKAKSTPDDPKNTPVAALTDKSQAIMAQLGSGDQIDALQEIVTAFAGEEEESEHREDIWAFVAEKCPDSRFTARVRRRIYKAILQEWKHDADIQRGESIVERALLLVEKLYDLHDGEGLERKYGLEVVKVPKSSVKKAKKKRAAPPPQTSRRKHDKQKRKYKSVESLGADDILDDDDDDDNDG